MRDITHSVLTTKITPKTKKLFTKVFLPALIVALGVVGSLKLAPVFGATNPSVSIDQCDNGAVGGTPVKCANPGNPNNHWGSGNLTSSKAHWKEGDVLPYRAVLKNLNPGVNTVTFSFDTAKSSELKHAIDYLASYDTTETTGSATATHANQIDPCGDVFACIPSSPTATAAITVPSYFTTSYPTSCANGSFQGAALSGQLIKAWSAAAGGVSAMSLSYPGGAMPTTGDCTPSFKITFTVAAGTSSVVIAWGGHIAANLNPGTGGYWGAGNAIPSGSPYHMHAGFPQESPVPTSFTVGNQDLQLASSAVVAPDNPPVTTAIHSGSNHTTDVQGTTLTLGSTIHDKATVDNSLGNNGTPAGTVIFDFFNNGTCNGTPASSSSAQALVGGAVDATGFSQGPLGPGSYSFLAHYTSSDTTKWNSVNGSCEAVSVGQAQLTVSTNVHDSSHTNITGTFVVLGSVVHDQATLSGAISGFAAPAITFTLYNAADCAGTGAAVTNTGADGAGVRSADSAALSAGSYSYKASVAGSANYLGDDSDCENFSVNTAQLGISTTVHDSSHIAVTAPLALGSSVHDSATVTGKVGSFGLPNVTFYFFDEGVTCVNGNTSGGTQLSAVAPDSGGVADPSDVESNLAAGTYNFMAVVASNGNYTGTTSSCESFTVDKAQLSINTTVHDSNHDAVIQALALGSSTHDTATVGGGVAGFDVPAVSFTLTNSYTNSCASGSTVSNNGMEGSDYASAASGALGAGSYAYRAAVAGDDNYIGATGTCELFNVNKAQLGINTTVHNEDGDIALVGNLPLGGGAHDSASVTDGISGFSLPDVTFYFFYSVTACTDRDTTGATTLNTKTPTAAGLAHPSDSQTNLAAGTYNFMAKVAGNSNYDGATSVCEPFTVDKSTPDISTEIHQVTGQTESVVAGALPLGSTVHDKATVTGAGISGLEPSGDVQFTFYVGDCNQSLNSSSSGSAPLDGSDPGIAHPSDNESSLAAGDYHFTAHYVGDSNYNEATSDCEPLTISPAQLGISTIIHDANHGPITTASLGSVVHDTASVTGQVGSIVPTGAVTFTFFSSANCTTGDSVVTTIDDANDPIRSADSAALAAGSYSYQASVAGDANYLGATATCEPLTINKTQLSVETHVHDPLHTDITNTSVGLATVTHDTATVSGAVNGFAIPAVSFTLTTGYVNSCSSGATVANNGTEIGGDYASADSSPLNAGSYAYMASVGSDSNYDGSSSSCEPFTVNQGSAGVVTEIHDAAEGVVSSVDAGTTVHDKATVTGGIVIAPTGSVSFTFFTNATCDPANNSGTAAGSNIALVSGVSHPSSSEGPLNAGSYSFLAHYNGDTNYAATDAACEPLTVNQVTPSIDTTASAGGVVGIKIHDTASVTGGYNPTGTVTFYLFGPNDTCSNNATALFTETDTLTAGSAGPTADYTTLAVGTYHWKAVYSGDVNNLSVTSPCSSEPVTTSKASPSISTVPSAGGNVGVVLNDTATVSGGNIPTGSVTFNLYSPSQTNCTGTPAYTSTDDSAPYATSPGFTTNAAGTWRWTATYNGDANNNTATSGCNDEQVTITQPVLLWCSPGFWAQALDKNRTGVLSYLTTHTTPSLNLNTAHYSSIPSNLRAALSKKAPAGDPTLAQVLASPNTYGGPAFNSVADYIAFRLGWNGTQNTGEHCPLDAHGNFNLSSAL